MGRIEKEKKVVQLMVGIYCNKKHGYKDGLCEECDELVKYAFHRLTNCKFGEVKPTCAKCPIHCYKKDMRQKIKKVMRFSGPRVLIYKPMEFIRHLYYDRSITYDD